MTEKKEARADGPVRPIIRPTANGLAQPPVAANVATIAQEIGGFTLTFYAVPADAFESPAARAQIEAQRGKRPDGVVDVSLEMEPAAKLFLPITTVAGLIRLLSDGFQGWNQAYAGELRSFLDAQAKPK